MSLLEEKDNQYICKYGVVNLTFSCEKEEFSVNFPNILNIEYILNIENNLTSVLKISMKLDIRKKSWIIKNRKKIRVTFQLSKYKFSQDNDNLGPSGDYVLAGKYVPIFTEASSSTDSASLMDSADAEFEESDLDNEDYLAGEEVMDIYLFRENILRSSRKVCNRVFCQENLQNIVAELLTETNHKNVLMNKFDNDETYYELLIPANPLYKTLLYLDEYFGFYKEGSIIFYDDYLLYILNSSMKKPIGLEDEELNVNILIDNLNFTTPSRGIVERDGDKDLYLYIAETDINLTKASWLNERDIGSIINGIVINPENESKENSLSNSKVEADISYIGEETGGERIESFYLLDHENKYAKENLVTRLAEGESVAYINTMGIDISYIKPNKIYKFIFSNVKKHEMYKKCKYRLAMVHHFLTPEDNFIMGCSSRFILKKCEGKINEDIT